jgi:MFS family permease
LTSTPESTESPDRARRIAQRTLLVLVLVNVMSQIDRHVMNVLLPEIKLELGLSDPESGLLVGFAFAVCHSLAGVPLARGFAELFIARIGVGIGEAGSSPAAQSLISDSFPAAERGRGLATYQLGVPIGILIGSIAASIMLLSMNLIGYGLGPPIAGFVSDALGGEEALRYALASMNLVLAWSCLHYWLASRTYRADLRAKTAWSNTT